MYEKARRGESIELSPRRISIFQFEIERSLDDRLLISTWCFSIEHIYLICDAISQSWGYFMVVDVVLRCTLFLILDILHPHVFCFCMWMTAYSTRNQYLGLSRSRHLMSALRSLGQKNQSCYVLHSLFI